MPDTTRSFIEVRMSGETGVPGETGMSGDAGTLVFAPNWLGDAVMALPAIADLKRHAPASRVTVAARPSVSALFQLAPYVDDIVTLEWRGRVLSRAGLRGDVERLRQVGASRGVLFPNSFASAWLLKKAGVPERSGYASDGRSFLLSRAVRRPAASLHQGEYYQRLVGALGVPSGPLEPRLEVPAEDVAAARGLLESKGWTGSPPLVVLAPGAAYGTAKRWLPRHFATLIASLLRDHGAACVLVGGPSDADATALVRASVPALARERVFDLAGATSLRVLAGVLRVADACVSNDSGAMHVAAAVGAPLVALFGATNERETSPLSWRDRPSRVLTNSVWCRPCMLRECPIDHRCMTGLEPRMVVAAVEAALAAATAEAVPRAGAPAALQSSGNSPETPPRMTA
jgi:heptosyltransferase II